MRLNRRKDKLMKETYESLLRDRRAYRWGWYPIPLIVTVCSWTFYNLNNLLNYVIILIYLFVLVYSIYKKQLELLYFPLIFFDTVLVLPIGGSFFPIYELAFLINLIINRKFKIPKDKMGILIGIYIFMGCAYVSKTSTLISMCINAFIMFIIISDIYKDKNNRKNFLIIFALGATVSGCYGLVHNNGINFGYGIRYAGSIDDPNYSALFYVYGIIAILSVKSIKKKYKMLLLIVLFASLLRTISLTGIVGCIALVLLFNYIKNPKKGFLLIFIFTVAFIIFLGMKIPSDSMLYGIHTRIINVIADLNIGDFNSITSSRNSIFKLYMSEFNSQSNIFRIALGGKNVINEPLFGVVSHNSFIDLLFMNGIIGLVFVITWFVIRIIYLIIKYKKTGDETYLGIAFIKITTLYFALTISIYSYRYFNMSLWL